jgi:hypothetical protein
MRDVKEETPALGRRRGTVPHGHTLPSDTRHPLHVPRNGAYRFFAAGFAPGSSVFM